MSRATDVAWAAGFLDGDGTVVLLRRPAAHGFTYGLKAIVFQNQREPLEVYVRLFGGNVTGPNKVGVYQWATNGDLAADALEAMLPYLRVKRDQAMLGIEFQAMLAERHGSRVPLTEKEMAVRADFARRMQDLNHRHSALPEHWTRRTA